MTTDFKVTYKNNIYPGTATATVTGIGDYKGTVTKTFTIREPSINAPKKVSVRLAKNDYDGIYASWKEVKVTKAAVKYKVDYRTENGNWETAAKGTKNTFYTIKSLEDGKKITVRVTPYVVLNVKTYMDESRESSGIYTLKKLNKPKVKKAGGTKACRPTQQIDIALAI